MGRPEHRPARRAEPKATAIAIDGLYRTAGQYDRPGLMNPIEQALMKFAGMKRGMRRIKKTAVVEIASYLSALLRPRNEVALDLQPLGLICNAASKTLVRSSVMGRMEAADFVKVAVDSLAADEITDPLERVQSLTPDA